MMNILLETIVCFCVTDLTPQFGNNPCSLEVSMKTPKVRIKLFGKPAFAIQLHKNASQLQKFGIDQKSYIGQFWTKVIFCNLIAKALTVAKEWLCFDSHGKVITLLWFL